VHVRKYRQTSTGHLHISAYKAFGPTFKAFGPTFKAFGPTLAFTHVLSYLVSTS